MLNTFLGPRGPLVVPSILPSRPVHPSAPIFPEFIDELYHCRQAPGTLQSVYFLKAHDVSYPNSDENKNTEINTNTKTNKGETWDTYDVIYLLKGDDKRILNMIWDRQGLENTNINTNTKTDTYNDKRQTNGVICFWK